MKNCMVLEFIHWRSYVKGSSVAEVTARLVVYTVKSSCFRTLSEVTRASDIYSFLTVRVIGSANEITNNEKIRNRDEKVKRR